MMHPKQVSSTAYNDQSSRSHTLCRLLVESSTNGADLAGPGVVATKTTAWLTLVDLAGADRAAHYESTFHIVSHSQPVGLMLETDVVSRCPAAGL